MTGEQFRLTHEMIQEIEDHVNNMIQEVNNGMKERLVKAGCYTEWACVEACCITINIEDLKVNVSNPVRSYEDEEEEEDDFGLYADEDDELQL